MKKVFVLLMICLLPAMAMAQWNKIVIPEAKPTVSRVWIVNHDVIAVLFPSKDRVNVSNESRRSIVNFVTGISGKARIIVRGYINVKTGTGIDNQRMSEKLANDIATIVMQAGVSADRIERVSTGFYDMFEGYSNFATIEVVD
ncbi:MAG: hypothetical protein IJ190_05775 [Prevotella sp.]|nr:hypothetical protein [Prevotella sp.]